MNVELVVDAHMNGGHHKGVPIGDKTNMTIEGFVENVINSLTFVDASFGRAFDLCSECGCDLFGILNGHDILLC